MAISEKDMHYLRKYTDRELNEYEKSLDDLESKGKNIQNYRDAVAIIRAERTPEARAQSSAAHQANKPKFVYNLDKLAPYTKAPLDINTAFFKDTVGTGPFWLIFGGRDKWMTERSNGKVCYASVVQANHVFYKPGTESGFAVFLFTPDENYTFDKEWLTNMAEKLVELRDNDYTPQDCEEIVAKLRDENSSFYNLRVPNSITNGVEAYCNVMFIMTSNLPHNCLPTDEIVPYLLVLRSNKQYEMYGIPAKYYN